MDIDTVVALIKAELERANEKFAMFNSPHEGKAVIEEELDELWDEVKANRGRAYSAMAEAVQVSAMAAKYLMSCGTQAQGEELLRSRRHRVHGG